MEPIQNLLPWMKESAMINSVEVVGTIYSKDRWATIVDKDEVEALAKEVLRDRYQAISQERQQHLKHLPEYLLEAQDIERLFRLISDLAFLTFKLLASNPQELINDFERLLSSGQLREDAVREDIQHIAEALRLSSHVLSYSPGQFPEQLLSRLPISSLPIGNTLRVRAALAKSTAWLRPLYPNLVSAYSLLLRTLVGHPGLISALTLLGNSRLIASADDQTITIWNIDTGQIVQTIAVNHEDDLTDLTSSFDGSILVATFRDGTLQRWHVSGDQEPLQFGKHDRAALAVVILPDGRVLSGGTDGKLRFWDLDYGTPLGMISGSASAIHCLAVTLDGRLAVSGGGSLFGSPVDNAIVLWDLDRKLELATLQGHSAPVEAIIFTPEGDRILSASMDNSVRIWDVTSKQLLYTFVGHKGLVRAVVVTPDAQQAISAADDELKIWDLVANKELLTLTGHTGLVSDIAVSPDGRLAISASWDQTLRIWNITAATSHNLDRRHREAVERVTFSPDGRYLISASRDRTLKLWNVEQGEFIRTIGEHTHWVTGVAISLDGTMAISTGWDQTLRLWELATGTELLQWRGHEQAINVITLSPDGQYAITASKDKKIIVWNVADGTEVCAFAGHTGNVVDVGVTPDGRFVVSGSEDKSIRVWSFATGNEVARWEGHEDRVTAIAIVNNQHVLSTSWDQTVRLWDIMNGSNLQTMQGSPCGLSAVTAIPGKALALTCGGLPYIASDNTLRLWNIVSGAMVARVIGDSPLTAIAVTQTGVIAVGDSLGGVHFYQLSGQIIADETEGLQTEPSRKIR